MVQTGNDALIGSWELSLHDKSARTKALYLSELRRFERWLDANERPLDAPGDLLAVTRQDVETWVRDLQSAGLAKATVRSRWIALRNFYGWLLDEEEIDVSPVAKVVVQKPDPPPPTLLSDDDLRALLRACEGRTFGDRRDLALIRFMLATGLRASEVAAVTVDDIDLKTRIVQVRHGKGDRFRLDRFDPKTAVALDRYRRVRARHRLASRPELWIGHRGPITRKGLGSILAKRSELAGIPTVNPHLLRHQFAHRFKNAGGQESDLMNLGGWSSSDVMRRYGAAAATDRALAAYDDVNPMGDL